MRHLPLLLSFADDDRASLSLGFVLGRTCPYRKSIPNVLVMQTTKMRLCEDPTDALNCAPNRRVLVQRQMRAGLVVICQVRWQHQPKVTLAKHYDMIECLLPDRANQAFSIGVLPGRSRCRWSVANAHRAKPPDECLAINAIAIANDMVRSSLPAASLRHLPSNPFGRRVCRHPQPHDSTSMVPQDQEPIQQLEGKRRHDEQVHGGDAVGMIAKKGPPAL